MKAESLKVPAAESRRGRGAASCTAPTTAPQPDQKHLKT